MNLRSKWDANFSLLPSLSLSCFLSLLLFSLFLALPPTLPLCLLCCITETLSYETKKLRLGPACSRSNGIEVKLIGPCLCCLQHWRLACQNISTLLCQPCWRLAVCHIGCEVGYRHKYLLSFKMTLSSLLFANHTHWMSDVMVIIIITPGLSLDSKRIMTLGLTLLRACGMGHDPQLFEVTSVSPHVMWG